MTIHTYADIELAKRYFALVQSLADGQVSMADFERQVSELPLLSSGLRIHIRTALALLPGEEGTF
jgi:hypothetical protein